MSSHLFGDIDVMHGQRLPSLRREGQLSLAGQVSPVANNMPSENMGIFQSKNSI